MGAGGRDGGVGGGEAGNEKLIVLEQSPHILSRGKSPQWGSKSHREYRQGTRLHPLYAEEGVPCHWAMETGPLGWDNGRKACLEATVYRAAGAAEGEAVP